ncbi:hypothetical protein MLD59_03835 [Verrucomicrobiaceae bacterium E54]|nr:hypothetical protein [Verrucomicrobiaceae bacterium E54]
MTEMDGSENRRPRRGVVIFLSLLPLWLVISTGIGLWLWNRGGENQPEQAKFKTPISAEGLESDLRKIVEIAGPRHLGSDRGHIGLKRVSAMIRSSLGPENAGYALEMHPGPTTPEGTWPLVLARLPGEGKPLAVVAGYDSREGSPGVEANGTGLASVLAIAQAMAGETLGRPVTFAFVPHAYDLDAPVREVGRQLMDQLGDVELIIVVEATGTAADLIVSARNTALLESFENRVRIAGAETICLGEDHDPASLLEELGAPAVRLSTRAMVLPSEQDDVLPGPGVHAQATAHLATLVRILAGAR